MNTATAIATHVANTIHSSGNHVANVIHSSGNNVANSIHTHGTHATTHHKSKRQGRHFSSGLSGGVTAASQVVSSLGSTAIQGDAIKTAANTNKEGVEYSADQALASTKVNAQGRVDAVNAKALSDQQIQQKQIEQNLYASDQLAFTAAQTA